MIDIFGALSQMRTLGQEGVLITVVDKKGSGPSMVGGKLLVLSTGERIGTVGGGELEALALQKATELMAKRSHHLQVFTLSGDSYAENQVTTNMACGGTVTLFFEFLPFSPTVYVFGSGHVGRAVLWYLQKLDYLTVVVDTRVEAARAVEGVNRVLTGDYP
ncbi:MAG: XdhC family protein, partial [Bacillota bacterium]